MKKRKEMSPDIEKKKHQQAIEREQRRDLKHELDEQQEPRPRRMPRQQPRRGHK